MPGKSVTKVLRSLKQDKYAFINHPPEIPKGYFDKCREKLSRKCSQVPGLLSLHCDPRVFHNGLGKMVFIGVFEPRLANPARGSLSNAIRETDPEHLLNSEILTITPGLFKSLRRFDCLLEPEIVWGNPIAMDPLAPEQARYNYVARLMDLFASGYLETFVRAEAQREVDTQSMIGRILQLDQILGLARQIIRKDHNDSWEKFSQEVTQTTSQWHQKGLKRYMDLMPVIRSALSIVLDTIAVLDTYFVKSNIVNLKPGPDPETPDAAFVTEDSMLAFLHPWAPGRALEVMLRLEKQHKQFIEVLPCSFALQLYEYSRGNGSFHKYVRSCFKMESMSGHMERPNISVERGELLEQYASFITSKKMDSDRRLVFGCNLKPGLAVAKAIGLVKSRKNVSRRNKFVRLLLQSDQHAFAHGT